MTSSEGTRQRVLDHITQLRAAGYNTEAFFDALLAIRDDAHLQHDERQILYQLIGAESYIWYLEAVKGEPLDRIAMLEESFKQTV